MDGDDAVTLIQMFRADPVQSSLFTIAPIAIAVVQLLNSYANDLSVAISVPFAITLLAFAGVLTWYQLAQFRVERLYDDPAVRPAD